MAINVLSSDVSNTRIYRHDGFSDDILNNVLIGGSIYGLGWDGTNALTTDISADRIYKYNGFSNSLLDSFSSPRGTPLAVAWDGTNVLSTDNQTYNSERVYKHDGFSAVILDCFSSPGHTPNGIDWYDGKMYVCNGATVYRYDGFTSSSEANFAPGRTTNDISFDGTDIYSTADTDKIYKHDGFSAVILDSFSSPYSYPFGLALEVTGC